MESERNKRSSLFKLVNSPDSAYAWMMAEPTREGTAFPIWQTKLSGAIGERKNVRRKMLATKPGPVCERDNRSWIITVGDAGYHSLVRRNFYRNIENPQHRAEFWPFKEYICIHTMYLR